MKIELAERFDKYATEQTSNGCLLWTGTISRGGYGRMNWQGRKLAAHRVAWELVHGPISDNKFVLHKCDIRRCVEISHLFLGTQLDNMRDASQKGKLTQKIGRTEIKKIVTRYVSGETMKRIAETYEVDSAAIFYLLKREGVPRRPNWALINKLSSRQVHDILTLESLGAKYFVDPTTILYYLKKNNAPRRARGKR